MFYCVTSTLIEHFLPLNGTDYLYPYMDKFTFHHHLFSDLAALSIRWQLDSTRWSNYTSLNTLCCSHPAEFDTKKEPWNESSSD